MVRLVELRLFYCPKGPLGYMGFLILLTHRYVQYLMVAFGGVMLAVELDSSLSHTRFVGCGVVGIS